MTAALLDGAVRIGEHRVSARGSRRAVANFDEDAVTLAAEAAAIALEPGGAPLDALILASLSLPYAQGGSAQLLVELLSLSSDTLVVELGATLRDGLLAIRLADGLLSAGAQRVLVVGAHRARADERDCGDGAVALLLGRDGGLARLTPGVAHAEELRDRWRLPGEEALHVADPSFADNFGAARVARGLAARGAENGASRVAVIGPAPGAAARAERDLGGAGDSLAARTGVLGSAHPLLRLLDSLEQPTTLLAASGGLGEALLCEPEPAAAALAGRLRDAVAGGRDADAAPAAHAGVDFHPYQSAPRAWRESGQDLRLQGLRYGDRLHYPPPAVPPPGHEGETGVPVALARTGKVLTQTRDHVYPGAAVTQMVVLDLDDGTRFYAQVAAGDELEIGDAARLVPRRLHDGGIDSGTGFIQYFWKASSCR
jgi:hydroxymethylglutaryl-CoA synthase